MVLLIPAILILILITAIFIFVFRQKIWQRVDKSIYIHLTQDGKIFIIKGSGEEKWISLPELKQELDEIKRIHGEILYSRERPSEENPFFLVKEVFDEIASYQLPLRIVEQHPRTREV
jgi:uncharacterized SAM-binding protein YcdF (DUF218 family)